MKEYRLNRLFDPTSGCCLDVAIDHGFFGERRHVKGIENVRATVAALIEAAPDAIQLSVGQAHHLQGVRGPKPALVMRTDVANIYPVTPPQHQFSIVVHEAVEQAIRLDATTVVVNLLEIPDHPEIYQDCLANVSRLKPVCERYAMPLMVEPLAMRPGEGGYGVNGDAERIGGLVRQAVELGADIIKADPTDDVSRYHEIVELAGDVPVLVRGGGKVGDRELLQRTRDLMDQGAKGIVYGRNIVQHESPPAITRALMSIVHDGASTDDALELAAAA